MEINRTCNSPSKTEHRSMTSIQSYYPTKNNARIEYKYSAIFYGYLDSWLFCTVKKNLFNQSAARATLLYQLCSSRLMSRKT